MTSTTTRRPPALAAAGGVLWRVEDGQTLVAVVHRPRYDDWTLPKGKLDEGESLLRGAVREVHEETGALVEAGRRLASVEYMVGSTRKRVSYWAMRQVDGAHTPNRETDEVRWLTIAEATKLLSYPIDRGVLADFARLPAHTGMLLLWRHAKAGKRSEWTGEDRLRPLDRIGRRQARDAVPFLSAFAPVRLLSADRVRCTQTIQPLSSALHLPVETITELTDEGYLGDPRAGQRAVAALADLPGTTVVCSQGKAIPALLADLDVPAKTYAARKGSVWALSMHKGVVVAADYYPHPN